MRCVCGGGGVSQIVTASITHNGKQLLMTAVLVVVVVYISSILCFFFFRDFFQVDVSTRLGHQVLHCALFTSREQRKLNIPTQAHFESLRYSHGGMRCLSLSPQFLPELAGVPV